MALFTLVMIAWFSSLILWVARTLDQAAAQRAQAEGAATRAARMAAGDARQHRRRRDRHRRLGARALPQRGGAAPDRLARGRGGRHGRWTSCSQLFDERDGTTLRNPLNSALAARAAAAAGGEPALARATASCIR